MMVTIVNALTGVFEAIVTLMLIKAYAEKPKPFYVYILGALVLTGITNISNRIFNNSYLNIIILIVMVFGVAFCFTRSIKLGMLIGAISAVIFITTEFAVFFLMSLLTDATATELTDAESYRITGAILSKLFAFVVMKIICAKREINRGLSLKASYWALFIVVFLVSALSIYGLYILQYYSIAPHAYNNLAIWCALGLTFMMFFTLYLYEKIIEQTAEEQRQEMLRQQFRAQAKHIDEILLTQTEMKKLRHDLRNHDISLKAYLEKGDCKGALDYLEKMCEQSSHEEELIKTGNTTLDAILNTKRRIAISQGIQFDIRLKIPANLFMDPIDICMIFGNALDNAIEACERMQSGKKWISLSLVYEEGTLLCKIHNSAEIGEGPFLKTIKADQERHGIGISSIEAALEKYKSIHSFEQTEEEFSLFFQINEK